MSNHPDSIKRYTKVMGIILLIGAAIPLVIGIVLTIRTYGFTSSAERTQGEVVAMEGTDAKAPVVSFKDRRGIEHQIISSVASSPPSFAVGETVEVLYDPANPDEARIDSFFQLWFGAFLGLVMGGGALFLTLIFIFLGPRFLRMLSGVFASRPPVQSPR
jgi:hypothetical protein